MDEPKPKPRESNKKGCERPLPTKIVGKQCEKIWATVMETNKHVISIHGRIGVGKTTVLKYLNNQFLQLSYDFVVFIVFTSLKLVAPRFGLQGEIATQIGLADTDDDQKRFDEKNAEIFHLLSGKRYALLIDDLCVEGVGGCGEILGGGYLPHPNSTNQCKIVIVAPHNHKFAAGTHMIQMMPLPWDDAWSLFKQEIGRGAIHSGLLAKVALLCQGLPKALIKVGRLMQHNTNTLEKWQTAIEILNKCDDKYMPAGMEFEDVAQILCDELCKNSMFKGRVVAQTTNLAINCYDRDHNRLCKIGRGLAELKNTLPNLKTIGGTDENQSLLDIVEGLTSYICKS